MQKNMQLTQRRIDLMLGQITECLYKARRPLTIEAHSVGGEPIPAEEALAGSFEPHEIGELWGRFWDTTWFRFSVQIPEGWQGEEVIALVDLGFPPMPGNQPPKEGHTVEGLVWRDGKPIRAINVNRMDIPISKSAVAGEPVQFYVEAASNPNAWEDGEQTLPVTGIYGQPSFRLKCADIACVDRQAFDFYYDALLALDALNAMHANEPRRGQLLFALNSAANIFDKNNRATIAPAREALREVLASPNGGSAHTISAIGHAHIDTAWFWPMRETIRKCARNFSTMLAYIDEHPGFIFSCSQPVQYAWMKQYYPSIYDGIKRAVKNGSWEPIGSAWVEPDTNIPSGEAFIRQIVHGKRFFQDEFGVDTVDLWLPDIFGDSANLPQILLKSGIKYYMTQKLATNQYNKFPHHTFLWEGIDGSRIFTHFSHCDCRFTPSILINVLRDYTDHDRTTCSLYTYGYGDGGGGPTKEMIEMADRLVDFEGAPKVVKEKVVDYFEKAVEDAKDLPVWVGELYYECHRGTYTSQANCKKNNRKSEILMHDAEFLDSVVRSLLPSGAAENPDATVPAYAVYDVFGRDVTRPRRADDLDRAWKLLLLNQFHDIIPGSSIHWVSEDADRDYETIGVLGNRVLSQCLDALTERIDTSGAEEPVVVFNTLSQERSEVVTLPGGRIARVQAPSMGYATIDAATAQGEVAAPVTVGVVGENLTIDNGIVRVAIDPNGLIESVFDYRANRQSLQRGVPGNLLKLYQDLPLNNDAWDIDLHYREVCEDLVNAERVEIVEQHPLRASVQVTRKFGNSSLVQRIVVRSGSARIDFETDVDWHEDHKLLKAAFPINVLTHTAAYDIQFGHLERPTHMNTSWDVARFEVCGQKWADLSESGYGVALLNDCKYGYDVVDQTIRLSLLRSPTWPDRLLDRGRHTFTYSLLPHRGTLGEGRVNEEAYALNVPLLMATVRPHGGELPASCSFFSVDRQGVEIETVKAADDGRGLILRLYEAHGGRGSVSVSTALPVKSVMRTDLLENDLESVDVSNGTIKLDVTPFEIVTLRLEKDRK